MKVHEKQGRTPLTVSRYLIWFQRYQRLKNRKITLKNWFTTNNNNQNCDVIRFACRSVSYNITITQKALIRVH